MADIFLSYARSERERVLPLVTAFEAQGWSVWWDQRLESGQSWDATIENELDEARIVVTVFSAASVDSKFVRAESLEALDSGKLLPIRLDEVKIPLNFRTVQYLDLIDWPERRFDRIEELLRTISQRLDREVPDEFVLPSVMRRRRRPIVISVISLFIALAGLLIWYGLKPPQTMRTEPLTILIADFDNRTGESLLDDSVEEALHIGLEGAPFISVYPRRDARRVADQQAGDTLLNPEISRLVATREGIDMILLGEIAEADGLYSVQTTGVDAGTNEERFNVKRSGLARVDLLPAIAALSTDARRSLGDVEIEKDHLTETLTTSSLDAMAVYFDAQRLALNWQHAEAVELYEKAVELDEKMARAYSGWALSEYYLGNPETSSALFKKAIALSSRLTKRERYRTLANYYVLQEDDTTKAIETFQDLIEDFPNEPAGLNNLAVAYAVSGQFANAVEAGRKVLAIYPGSSLYQGNLGLYLMYASELEEAAEIAAGLIEAGDPYYSAYLPEAIAALDAGDLPRATEAHEAMAAVSESGESFAAITAADAMLFLGRAEEARRILDEAISVDLANGRTGSAALKQLLLASTHHELNDPDLAHRNVDAALEQANSLAVNYLAADHFLKTGESQRVDDIITALSDEVDAQSRAIHALITARQAFQASNNGLAMDSVRTALGLRDYWIARYWLGRIYLASGNPVQALTEFERCIERRGEAAALFVDEVATFRYLPEVYYWLGRSSEEAGVIEAAIGNYEAYVDIRADARPKGKLFADAEMRLTRLQAGQ